MSQAKPNGSTNSNDKPKLLDQVRNALRVRHLALSTEKTYVDWIRRFILFHNKRHPLEMGKQLEQPNKTVEEARREVQEGANERLLACVDARKNGGAAAPLFQPPSPAGKRGQLQFSLNQHKAVLR